MVNKKLERVYCTKYALTKGIIMATGHEIQGRFYQAGWCAALGKGEWARNANEALAQAERMRTKKIASLEKQLIKVKKKSFSSLPDKAT